MVYLSRLSKIDQDGLSFKIKQDWPRWSREGAKRCNYAVKYKTDNNTFKFGMIKYFLQINKKVLGAITELKVIEKNLIKLLAEPVMLVLVSKTRECLISFFSDVREIKNNFSFINLIQLSSKCIKKRTPAIINTRP